MNKITSKTITVVLTATATLAALAISASLPGCKSKTKKDQKTQVEAKKIPAIAAQIKLIKFEDNIKISGNVLSICDAVVSARTPGVLDDIFVEKGDVVIAGKTQLFQVDRASLQNAVQAYEQQVNVAAAAVSAAIAGVDRISADLDKAKLDTERYQRLYKNNKAVTKFALEDQESRYKQLAAALLEAQAGLELAKAQAKQSESRLSIARKDLSDSLVLSPINGIVADRMMEPGEMAEIGTPILTIVDLSALEVSAFLPEKYYSRVTPGKTIVRVSDGSRQLGQYRLSYKSPVVDNHLRTFEVKAEFDPGIANVAPGMLVKLTVILDSHDGLGVPVDSVITRAGKSSIFIVDNGKARLVPVETSLQTDGLIEVVSDALNADMSVISTGQNFCEDGDSLTIIQEGN